MVPIFWFFTCLLWWFASLTIGLPITIALIFSRSFRASFFSWQYSNICHPIFQPVIQRARRRAFQILKECLKDRNKNIPLEIMEIGIGEGANLEYYPENVNLTVLDVNKNFQYYFEQKFKKFPHINFKRTLIQGAENMSQVEDNSLDVVVSTYLHCSCNDSDAVLKEVKRVLKPGGKYMFLDHVRYPSGDAGLYIQRLINPIWYLFFNGCHLDRDPAVKIKRAGFSDTFCEKFIEMNWSFYLCRHQIVGVATK